MKYCKLQLNDKYEFYIYLNIQYIDILTNLPHEDLYCFKYTSIETSKTIYDCTDTDKQKVVGFINKNKLKKY